MDKGAIVSSLRSRVLSSEARAERATAVFWEETSSARMTGINYYMLITDWPDFHAMFVRAVMLVLMAGETEAFAKTVVNRTGAAWGERLACAWVEDWPDARRLVLAMDLLYETVLSSPCVRAFLEKETSEFSDPALTMEQRLRLRLHSVVSTAAVNRFLRNSGYIAEVLGVGKAYPIPQKFE